MRLVKRAVLYLVRKRGRSVLLLAAFFLLSTALLAGISIGGSARTAAAKLRQTLGSSFTVHLSTAVKNMDNDALYETVDDAPEDGNSSVGGRVYIGPQVDDGLITQILSITGVSVYNAELVVPLESQLALRPGYGIALYEEALLDAELMERMDLEWLQYCQRCHYYFGCVNSSLHPYFLNGAQTLVKGRHILPGDTGKAVISEQLAQRNGLDIGDTFTANVNEMDTRFEARNIQLGDTIVFEVAGIYRLNFTQEVSEYTYECEYVESNVFCDMASVQQASRYFLYAARPDGGNHYSCATFFADSPDVLDKAIKKARASQGINWDFFDIAADESAYTAAITPVTAMGRLSGWLTALLAFGCAAVTTLLLCIWVKSRKREFGILLSIGKSKAVITTQLLLECVLVFVLAFALALLAAPVVTKTAGKALETRYDGSSGQYFQEYNEYNDMVLRPPSEAPALTYSISLKSAAGAAAAGAGTVFLAALLSALPVLRKKPRELLTDMD